MKQYFENPFMRVLAVIVMVAAGIRLVFELLAPVMLYLLAGLILFAVWRIGDWYRNRW